MHVNDLVPAPRCTFIGEDIETGKHLQCGRWENHPGDHKSRRDVLSEMYEAVCRAYGLDPDRMSLRLQGATLMHVARQWYRRLVIQVQSDDT